MIQKPTGRSRWAFCCAISQLEGYNPGMSRTQSTWLRRAVLGCWCALAVAGATVLLSPGERWQTARAEPPAAASTIPEELNRRIASTIEHPSARMSSIEQIGMV